MGEITLGYKPSDNMKDWQFGWDDGKPCYTQRVVFYCTGCKLSGTACMGRNGSHPRSVGKEPYYDLKAKKITKSPCIYITHHPKKGEWEHLKTVQDLLASPLFVKDIR